MASKRYRRTPVTHIIIGALVIVAIIGLIGASVYRAEKY
jgi:hypothetical protein